MAWPPIWKDRRMTAPGRQIAIVRSYDELIDALRARALELGATREAIDDVSGLQKGYSAKVLAPAAPKGLGRISMGPILNALGVMLVMTEDADAIARYTKRLGTGNLSYMLNGAKNAPVIFKFSLRHMKKIASRSAAGRMKKIPAWKRRAIARKAARARWRSIRAAAQVQ
jgi:hypothetical protein